MTPADVAILRAYRGAEDVPVLVEIWNAMAVADGLPERRDVDQLTSWWRTPTPHYDASRDVCIAEVDGVVRGWTVQRWVDTTDGLREFRVSGYVHPDACGRGIGRRILAWQEEHARAHPGITNDRPMGLGSWSPEERKRKQRLLERAGYTIERYFFDMLRPTLEAIEMPPMPDGIEIRPIGSDRASLKQLWDADVEAFADHWGGFDGSEAAFERSLADPDADPSLYVIAWDGDEIAGGVTNAIYREENEAFGRRRGWLETVFVRRAWRRRGLGAAIVARALARLREAGMSEAMLGVDSANPSGALGLYERAGFGVHTRSFAYRKPMEVTR
jgi:GNAT superfamily N-acetyltransferase